jgi:toxin YoeB
VARKLTELLEAVRRDPFEGIGKPEPLKRLGPGIWSRRITAEHRLVYRVEGKFIYLLQGRHHY